MLYQLLSNMVYCRDVVTRKWVELDFNVLPLKDLVAKYRDGEVPLKDLFDDTKTLHINDYVSTFATIDDTFPVWLGKQESKLITSMGYTPPKFKVAQYTPALEHKTTLFKLAERNSNPTNPQLLGDANDICVGYEEHIKEIAQHSLWSVNGYYCRAFYSGDYIRIYEGGELLTNSNTTSFGYLDFRGIGRVKTIPLTEQLVFSYLEETNDFHKIQIKVPDNLLSTHTPAVVIGGYLHILDDLFKVTGDSVLTLLLDKFDLADRIISSKDTLDLTFMGLDDLYKGKELKRLITPESILAYLTCKYSFLVLIENTNVFTTETPLDTNLPYGMAITDINTHNGLMRDYLGKGIDYWYVIEDGKKVFYMDDMTRPNRLMYKQSTLGTINDAMINQCPMNELRPYLLNISAKVITTKTQK